MKVSFTSLGCAKNLIDSEQMAALVTAAGHEIVDDPAEAEAAVVNTCAFIDAAQQEAIDAILELAELKKTGALRRLVVTGCLPQRYQGEILRELPEIDAVLGTGSFFEIVEALESEERHFSRFLDKNAPLPELPRAVSTGPAWAYIKVADGCSNRCAYCVIPSIRGDLRSRPVKAVVEEAEALSRAGVREIILIAQNLTDYGKDFRDGTTLVTLLRELLKVEGLRWIRLHYLYPHGITGELIDLIASEPRIVNYIDMPIQHVNDAILRRMRRPETKDAICALIRTLRERIPDVVLRTSLITGLPGEGEAELEELMEFLETYRLERAGVFVFSPQEGTPAAEMTDRCTTEEAEARRDRLMALQNRIMDEYDRRQVGGVFDVLCEGLEGDMWVGRRYADSPEIDEQVYFSGDAAPGSFARVRITDARDGCLFGEAV